MDKKRAHVFTIACDAPFLDILAQEILKGFPTDQAEPNLAALTVLVPTRRAARELQLKLLAESRQSALVLPSILPIGDIDEELLEPEGIETRLPNAISSIGRQFMLVGLIDEWISENPQLGLAQEIAHSAQQVQALAISMGELIDDLETEGVSPDTLPKAFDIDLAIHRDAILGLLDLVHKRLPARLHDEKLMGSKERRSLLISLQAKRFIESPPKGPIIAAGSTGTIPATRELLEAISQLERGAVILPGLDQDMDDESWANLSPQHPQYVLKQLIEDFGITRKEISFLGNAAGTRAWVASELMRPSNVADRWLTSLSGQRERMKQGLGNLSLLEARDKNEEASIIALIMRRELEKPSGGIALVTPDRDLARRVKAALLRWNIQVDDSAGEPLIRFGAASLLSLLMDAVNNDFNAPSLCALFAHPLSHFGFERHEFQRIARNLDLVLFRDSPMGLGLPGFKHAYRRALATKGKTRQHILIANLSDTDWQDMGEGVDRIAGSLTSLSTLGVNIFIRHLETLLTVAEGIAGEEFWTGAESEVLETLVTILREEGHRFPPCDFNRAATAIRQQLQSVPLRLQTDTGTRLSILGLLEARLIKPETIILGGLNEGKWPRQPDAGPWLNRPMRGLFAMPQPERQIGQMAHDFVQAFGAEKVYLTHSRRDGMTPAIPSRWILRLETIMKAVGLKPEELADGLWQDWAIALDAAKAVIPLKIPLPCPPVIARPRRLSVTRIEKLIRDPYAIYAQAVLGLEPLADVSAKPDAALRGTLFHAALGDFFSQYPNDLPDDALAVLIALGQKHFEPYNDTPEVAGFWWSRFRRIASWIIENEPTLRGRALKIIAEVDGVLDLRIGDSQFQLSARADRIDINTDGTAHIIDFKSGSPPSSKAVKAGFSPQLTLEAAMLEKGAFKGTGSHETQALTYVRISGGVPAGEIKNVDIVVTDEARTHLASLTALLVKYQNATQAYVPRFGMQREDDVSEFDHLSRYREWILSGDAS
jgi:ATP-dependent helicase/nuclease subunit B